MFKRIVNGEGRFLPLTTRLGDVVLESHLKTASYRFKTIMVTGRGLLDYKHTTAEVAGRNGKYFKDGKSEERVISVLAHFSAVDAPSLQEMYNEVNRLLKPQVETNLAFSDEEGYHYRAVYLQSQVEHEGKNEALIKMEFVCYDPMKYTDVKESTNPAIAYKGHEESKPLVTLTLQEEGTELRLLHVQQQRYVRVTGRFASGDAVVIDMKKRQITHKGKSILKNLDMVNSRFFSLSPGNNTLNSSLAASYKIEYREVYR